MATLARIQIAGFNAKRASIASVIMAAGAVAIVAITAASAVTQFRQVASTRDVMAIPGMTFAAFTFATASRFGVHPVTPPKRLHSQGSEDVAVEPLRKPGFLSPAGQLRQVPRDVVGEFSK
jgi:hypothetical protein